MIMIPGWFLAIFTFPGVIVHEAAHFYFCRLRGVAVYDVCYFRVGNPAGYVVHEPPRDFLSSFLIAIGPLLINTLLCFAICFPASVPWRLFDRSDPVDLFLLWLGLSIGMHAFPSIQDANVLMSNARTAARRGYILAILSYPLVALIHVANILSMFWFDYIYGAAVGLGLPILILEKFA
jgi:Putative zincin peptidase